MSRSPRIPDHELATSLGLALNRPEHAARLPRTRTRLYSSAVPITLLLRGTTSILSERGPKPNSRDSQALGITGPVFVCRLRHFEMRERRSIYYLRSAWTDMLRLIMNMRHAHAGWSRSSKPNRHRLFTMTRWAGLVRRQRVSKDNKRSHHLE